MSKKEKKLTDQVSMADFNNYRRVQFDGRWNMLSRQARIATGLGAKKFGLCQDHYAELEKEYGRYRP